MKKFTKLNESIEINDSKVESVLSKINLEYKLFDYFYIPKEGNKMTVLSDELI
jgi:hypothetical protein